jgi:transposase
MARQLAESAQIEAAIAAVQGGSMSLREAARRFDVPRTTLQRRVQRRTSEASGSAVSEPEAVDVKTEIAAPAEASANAQSDTSSEDTAESKAEKRKADTMTGKKRSAEHLEAHSQGSEL